MFNNPLINQKVIFSKLKVHQETKDKPKLAKPEILELDRHNYMWNVSKTSEITEKIISKKNSSIFDSKKASQYIVKPVTAPKLTSTANLGIVFPKSARNQDCKKKPFSRNTEIVAQDSMPLLKEKSSSIDNKQLKLDKKVKKERPISNYTRCKANETKTIDNRYMYSVSDNSAPILTDFKIAKVHIDYKDFKITLKETLEESKKDKETTTELKTLGCQPITAKKQHEEKQKSTIGLRDSATMLIRENEDEFPTQPRYLTPNYSAYLKSKEGRLSGSGSLVGSQIKLKNQKSNYNIHPIFRVTNLTKECNYDYSYNYNTLFRRRSPSNNR